jgi:predicted ATPase
MIVSRLKLRNWRNFRSLDLRFQERVFLIGPNASGKSNLLDVFRFLRDLARPGGGLQPAIAQRGGLSKIRCLAARREPDVEIDVELSDDGISSDWRYSIGVSQQVRGFRQPILRYEKVWKGAHLILERPDQLDAQDELRLTQTHLEQISANSGFRDVVRFFESIRYLVPQMLRQPDFVHGTAAQEDPFGRNFLEMVARTPEKTRKSRLARIEAALRKAVPQLTKLTDTKDDSGVPHLEATYAHWRPNAGRQREDQFSDGTLRLIGLFWSLLDGEGTLLLEEPELSLHSEIVSKLPGLIFSVQRRRKRQIFVSTHSWELLSQKSIGGEEVIMLRPDQEGTVAEVASSNTVIREMLEAGLSVADAALPRTAPSNVKELELI